MTLHARRYAQRARLASTSHDSTRYWGAGFQATENRRTAVAACSWTSHQVTITPARRQSMNDSIQRERLIRMQSQSGCRTRSECARTWGSPEHTVTGTGSKSARGRTNPATDAVRAMKRSAALSYVQQTGAVAHHQLLISSGRGAGCAQAVERIDHQRNSMCLQHGDGGGVRQARG